MGEEFVRCSTLAAADVPELADVVADVLLRGGTLIAALKLPREQVIDTARLMLHPVCFPYSTIARDERSGKIVGFDLKTDWYEYNTAQPDYVSSYPTLEFEKFRRKLLSDVEMSMFKQHNLGPGECLATLLVGVADGYHGRIMGILDTFSVATYADKFRHYQYFFTLATHYKTIDYIRHVAQSTNGDFGIVEHREVFFADLVGSSASECDAIRLLQQQSKTKSVLAGLFKRSIQHDAIATATAATAAAAAPTVKYSSL